MPERALPGRLFVSALALSAWLGASLFFSTVVARAAFSVLPSRALAGALVAQLLPVLFVSGIIVGVLAFLVEVNERVLILRTPRQVAAVSVAVCSLVAQLIVAPRIERVRATIGPAVEALDALDPRRVEFGRLHAVSVGLLGLGLIASAVYLVTLFLASRPRN